MHSISLTVPVPEVNNSEISSTTNLTPVFDKAVVTQTVRPLAPPWVLLREALQARGILRDDGLLSKDLGALPFVHNLNRLSAIIQKELIVINKSGQALVSLNQMTLLNEIQNLCSEVGEKVTVFLRGSTAAYASHMEEYFLNGLQRADCLDLADLAKGLDLIQEPDDLDWQFDNGCCLDIEKLKQLRTGLINILHIWDNKRHTFKEIEKEAFMSLCIPTKKDPKTSKVELADEILIVSLGNAAANDPKKTDLVIGKSRRSHLFFKDDWRINVQECLTLEENFELIPTTSSENPWQPVFDKCLKMLHLTNPETVTLEGLATILLYRSRGESFFSISRYPVLRKLCTKGKNSAKLCRLLKRRLETHSVNPIAVTFNTSVLKARISLKKNKNPPKELVKEPSDFEDFWKEMASIFPKEDNLLHLIAETIIENHCSFEHVWAILHHAAFFRLNEASAELEVNSEVQVYRVYEGEGIKIQIHVNGSYLVFPLDLLGASYSLDKVKEEEIPFLQKIWHCLVPQSFSPTLEPSPFQKEILRNEQESWIKLLRHCDPFIQRVGFFLAGSCYLLNPDTLKRPVLIGMMPSLLKEAPTADYRQILFHQMKRLEPALDAADFEELDAQEMIGHRWVLSLCTTPYFDAAYWKNLELPAECVFEIVQRLSCSGLLEKAHQFFKSFQKALPMQLQIKGFEEICRGYKSYPFDSKTLKNLLNTLLTLKENISSESFEWLIAKTSELEGSLIAADLLLKMRSNNLYSYEKISEKGLELCLSQLETNGFEKFIVLFEKIKQLLSNSHKAECFKAAMKDKACRHEKFIHFLLQEGGKESSPYKEEFFIAMIENDVQQGHLESALKVLKQGEKWIQLEHQVSLKLKIFGQLVEQGQHDLIYTVLSNKHFMPAEQEHYRELAFRYFKGLMQDPLSRNALWKMQRLLLLFKQTFFSEMLGDSDFIEWIQFFIAMAKPEGKASYKDLTSYEAMFFQFLEIALIRSEQCSEQLLSLMVKLLDHVQGKEEEFFKKLRALLSPQFSNFLKRLSSQPEELLNFLKLLAWIRFPLKEDQGEAIIDSLFMLFKIASENTSLKNGLASVLNLWYPTICTKKNAFQVFHLYLTFVAQLHEKDQLKWINKFQKLAEQASHEHQKKIYDLVIERAHGCLQASQISLSMSYLQLGFHIPNIVEFSSCYGLVIPLCQTQYKEDSIGCLKFLITYGHLLKKNIKNQEFIQFISDFINRALDEDSIPFESIAQLLKGYRLNIPLNLWQKIIEKMSQVPSASYFIPIITLWDEKSPDFQSSLVKDNCWINIINFLLSEQDISQKEEILKRVATKDLCFFLEENTQMIYEKLLNDLLPLLKKLSTKSIDDYIIIRKELKRYNTSGQIDSLIFKSLKGILDSVLSYEEYEEALSYIENCLLDYEKKATDEFFQIFYTVISSTEIFDENERKKYNTRILQLINTVLKFIEEETNQLNLFKLFRYLKASDSFFTPTCLNVLLIILNKGQHHFKDEIKKENNRYLLNILIKGEYYDLINEILNHKCRFYAFDEEFFSDLRKLFVEKSFELLKEDYLMPAQWILTQKFFYSSAERIKMQNQLFEKLFDCCNNFEIFKQNISFGLDYCQKEKGKLGGQNFLYSFLGIAEKYMRGAFNDRREEFFGFIYESLNHLIENLENLKSPLLEKTIFSLCFRFIDCISFNAEALKFAQMSLQLAKERGVYERSPLGRYYYGATYLISCYDEKMDPEKLQLSKEAVHLENDDYMAMSILAFKLCLFKEAYKETTAMPSLLLTKKSTLETKERIIKILDSAPPFFDCHYLKVAHLSGHIKILQGMCPVIPQEEIKNYDKEFLLKFYNFLTLWGTIFLKHYDFYQEIFEAETVEKYINCHSNPLFKDLIGSIEELQGKRNHANLTGLYSKMIVERILYLLSQCKPFMEKEDQKELEKYVFNFTIELFKKTVITHVEEIKKLFIILNKIVIPILAPGYVEGGILDIDKDPFREILALTSAWNSKKTEIISLPDYVEEDILDNDKDPFREILAPFSKGHSKKTEITSLQLFALSQWMTQLLRHPTASLKKYCLNLLNRYQSEGLFKSQQACYLKMCKIVKNKKNSS